MVNPALEVAVAVDIGWHTHLLKPMTEMTALHRNDNMLLFTLLEEVHTNGLNSAWQKDCDNLYPNIR